MKTWKRTLALLLSLALVISLCACGDTADPTGGTANPSPDASLDPGAAPSIEVDLARNAVDFSAGLSPSEVLLTVNGEDVPAELFLYLLFWDCYYLQYNYYYYYGISVNLDELSGALLDDTVDMLLHYTVLRQKALELGCPLTDEQQAELEAGKTGEEAERYEQNKAAFGLTDASMDFLATLDYYHENLLETVPMPARDELDNYVYQTKHILIKTVDSQNQPLSGDEIAAQKALAEDILAQLRAVEGEERLELFDELMNQYSEDGRDGNGGLYAPDGYEAVLGDMVPDYEQGALALNFGEISGLVESSYGYHIILRQEVQFRDSTAEEYAEAYREYLLDEQMDQWTHDVEPVRTSALDALDVSGFYDRYFAYYNAVLEQYEAAGDGTAD